MENKKRYKMTKHRALTLALELFTEKALYAFKIEEIEKKGKAIKRIDLWIGANDYDDIVFIGKVLPFTHCIHPQMGMDDQGRIYLTLY